MLKTKRVLRILTCILAVWLVTGAFVSLTACKKDGDDGEGGGDADGGFSPYPYEDLSVFMDVPDYKNISLTSELVTRMIKLELAYFYRNAQIDTEVVDGGARLWDMVEITAHGFIGDELDPELSLTGYLLPLGSETFYVDGFEEALIGARTGESRGINLKFADDYPSEKYAGKDVSYTVSVDHIYRAPELTDALCKEHTVFETAEEYLEWLRSSCIFRYVWDGLVKKCVLKAYPNEEYTEYYMYFKSNFQSLAEENGMSFADFISKRGGMYAEYGLFSGMTTIDFEEVATNYAKSNLVNDLLTYSIVRAEGIKTEGEEFERAKAKLEKEYGSSYGDIVAKNGETAAIISVLNVRLCEVINSYVEVTE